MAEETTVMPVNGGTNGDGADDVEMVDADDEIDDDSELPSLSIPITSSEDALNKNLFIEIFPEEILETPSSTLLQVLKVLRPNQCRG